MTMMKEPNLPTICDVLEEAISGLPRDTGDAVLAEPFMKILREQKERYLHTTEGPDWDVVREAAHDLYMCEGLDSMLYIMVCETVGYHKQGWLDFRQLAGFADDKFDFKTSLDDAYDVCDAKDDSSELDDLKAKMEGLVRSVKTALLELDEIAQRPESAAMPILQRLHDEVDHATLRYKYLLDLKIEIKRQLQAAGAPTHNILEYEWDILAELCSNRDLQRYVRALRIGIYDNDDEE